jgi:methylase of polypeptide subunit release factors
MVHMEPGLISLSRKPLNADSLADVFGPKSPIARAAASALVDAAANWGGAQTAVYYREWQRLFGIVYGEQLGTFTEIKGAFARDYGVDENTDFQKLLFAIHTYFALLMKLVAAELVLLRDRPFGPSFSTQLLHASPEEFRELLADLEDGGVYSRRGVSNFLDGDFFRWYLQALSPRLEEAVREVARGLSEFEPATPALAPAFTQDLLKKLYQYLVPAEVRHRLGEYYTPDWLAELIMDETGYDGDTRQRLLDPACGSGTFLVQAIHRAKAYGRTHHEPPLETAKRIIANIWGFDLNPLAVIAARTNFLFALGDLIHDLKQIEIHIYLADSVQQIWGLNDGPPKNAPPPTMAGTFDFVIGNPPWIRWGCLSREYRKATLPLWREYGLFSLKGHAARLGGGEKDFSMLFTYAAIDHYLSKGGKLGFLITQEVFKSKGAGEGFRRFQLGERDHFRVLKAHDLATVQPFEGAANKTAAIVVKKGERTAYPVPYTVWTRKKRAGKIPTNSNLGQALPLLQKKKLSARPLGKPTGPWRTMERGRSGPCAIEGKDPHQARLGARVEPYGVFWLEVKHRFSEGDLLVRNMNEKGKRKLPNVEERIESDLVFPAVRGADIERWRATPGIDLLMPQDPQTREPFPEARMKKQWPRTYGYLARFKEVLLARGSRTVRELAQRTAFYAMYGIGPYTVAPYKVVWKRMAGDMVAAVISQHKTPYGFKTVIPTDTTSLFALDNEAESHFLCAVINSAPVREFIKSFSSAGRGFGAPSVMENVGIPRFDPKDPLHKQLSDLSLRLHDGMGKIQARGIETLEKQIDGMVTRLFAIAE